MSGIHGESVAARDAGSRTRLSTCGIRHSAVALRLHRTDDVSAVPAVERRSDERHDRRRRPRGGRRTGDPRVNWRRIAWLFAGYAAYLSIRSLPGTIRRLFARRDTRST
jgi:hypothetical protein